jgi:cell division control protein 7
MVAAATLVPSRVTEAEEGTFNIHEDAGAEEDAWNGSDQEMEDNLDEHETDRPSDSEDDSSDISPVVAEDIAKFEESFKDITKKYRLIDRIGEGKTLG